MLLQFSTVNFKSFKNEVTLNLVANNFKEHEERIIYFNNERVLPLVGVFGANASGKSNLLEAFFFAVNLIRNSLSSQTSEELFNIKPFMFDDSKDNSPSSFDFIFVKDGVKYEYGFAIDKKCVIEEYLYVYKSQKPSLVFERKNVNEYHFRDYARHELSPIVSRTLPNKLFLSVAANFNAKLVKACFDWFKNDINFYFEQAIEEKAILDAIKDEKMNKFIADFLNHADINISNIKWQIAKINNQQKINFKTMHLIRANGELKEFSLDIKDESHGTQKLLSYAPLFYKALNFGGVVVIDEIDNAIHVELMKYIISLFNDPLINKTSAQLIFNAQNALLLDLDIMRRDQICFVEKNFLTGVSSLYSLDEFKVRLDDKVLKKYLEGRYGALPNIIYE